jgi:hypothetical protein
MRRWVQNVKEITPRRPQLKPRPGDIEAQEADDASVISILAGAVVRAVEDVPPAAPAAPFSPLTPMLPWSLALGDSVPFVPLSPRQKIEAAALSPLPSVIWYLASGPIKLDGAA